MSSGKTQEPVSYRSSKESFVIHLSHGRTEVYDGQVINRPGSSVRFKNGIYSTDDSEIIKTLDSILSGPSAMKWRRRFWRLPSQKLAKKMAEAAESARKKEADLLEKSLSKEEKDEMSSFRSFIKKQKQKTDGPEHVTGPLDIERRKDSGEQPSETSI
jgi:hypothetical protein